MNPVCVSGDGCLQLRRQFGVKTEFNVVQNDSKGPEEELRRMFDSLQLRGDLIPNHETVKHFNSSSGFIYFTNMQLLCTTFSSLFVDQFRVCKHLTLYKKSIHIRKRGAEEMIHRFMNYLFSLIRSALCHAACHRLWGWPGPIR